LATHIVFTTYMTWPPGDPRGHWSPLFDIYGHPRARGDRPNPPDADTRRDVTAIAKESPKILSPGEIELIANVFATILRPPNPMPSTRCFAAAIEPNHVHLLLGPLPDAERQPIVGRLKGQSSSALRSLPTNVNRTRTWTAGYWHHDISDKTTLSAIRAYFVNHNIRRNLPADPYPWITPQ
jgi:REP element-mobilizing transposase RayT